MDASTSSRRTASGCSVCGLNGSGACRPGPFTQAAARSGVLRCRGRLCWRLELVILLAVAADVHGEQALLDGDETLGDQSVGAASDRLSRRAQLVTEIGERVAAPAEAGVGGASQVGQDARRQGGIGGGRAARRQFRGGEVDHPATLARNENVRLRRTDQPGEELGAHPEAADDLLPGAGPLATQPDLEFEQVSGAHPFGVAGHHVIHAGHPGHAAEIDLLHQLGGDAGLADRCGTSQDAEERDGREGTSARHEMRRGASHARGGRRGRCLYRCPDWSRRGEGGGNHGDTVARANLKSKSRNLNSFYACQSAVERCL